MEQNNPYGWSEPSVVDGPSLSLQNLCGFLNTQQICRTIHSVSAPFVACANQPWRLSPHPRLGDLLVIAGERPRWEGEEWSL